MALPYTEIEPAAQAVYSELADRLLLRGVSRKGLSIFTRVVKGRRYWYLESVIGSRKRGFYVGPDTQEVRSRVERLKHRWAQASEVDAAARKLVSMLSAAGYNAVSGQELRVLLALEQAGVFLAGGVLVGTYAFRAIGNMLGIHLGSAAARTQDIDLTEAVAILSVALPDRDMDVANIRRESEKGFFPVPVLDPRQPSTSFAVRGGGLRVDLLTPMRGKPSREPVALKSVKGYAAPVRYLEYLLDDVQTAALIGGGGILGNVPSPARFALHKLVVSQRRSASDNAKRHKDQMQAAIVLDVLLRDRPGDLDIALEAARAMPAGFGKLLSAGIRQILEPRIGAAMLSLSQDRGSIIRPRTAKNPNRQGPDRARRRGGH